MARWRVSHCSMCRPCCCCVFHRLSHRFVPTTKEDIDREPLLRGRLVLLVRVDYHTYWVSNAILSRLQNLPDVVDGGYIVRDGAGNPTGPSDPSRMTPAASRHNLIQTGVFVDKAMDLINELKPTPTEAETVECFETTMRDALRFGLTSIHDAAAHLRDITFFQR